MKFGMETIFGMANSILALNVEIDTFINYTWKSDKMSKIEWRFEDVSI